MPVLSRPPAQNLRALLPPLGTALAYGLSAWLALRLPVPPACASPLLPSAGIALACVLRFGWPALPGVAIAAFGVAVLAAPLQGQQAGTALLAAVFAIAASLQAGVGTVLLRRFLPGPLTLAEPRDVALFFGLGALLACLFGSTLAIAALGWSQALPREALAGTWWTWWSGDALGVMIGAPITLTLIGLPRSAWVPRRLTVGLPLLIVTLLMALALMQVGRWDEERTRALFEREANNASSLLTARLEQALGALSALRGASGALPTMTPDALRRAARDWLADDPQQQVLDNGVWSVGVAEWVQRSDIASLELRQRADGVDEFRVFDAQGASASATTADESAMVILHHEPPRNSARTVGLNQLSIGAMREAIDHARRTDRAAASAGFRLRDAKLDETAVGLVHALYRGQPTTMAERLASTTGLVFVTLRPEVVLRQLRGSVPAFIDLCIVDTDPSAERRVLAGAADCMNPAPDALLHVRSLNYAGRDWDIRASATRLAVAAGGRDGVLPFALVGQLAIALLGALLLTVTGRARRIETAVQERTADLQREIRERSHTEGALRDSEQRFRNMLNTLPVGVVYTDLRGFVKQANPAFCEMVGYSADDLLGMAVEEVTHPDDWQQEVSLSGRLVSGELPMVRHHKRLLASDGRTLWVRSSVSLLRDADGQPHRTVDVVEDITEHLRLEEAERARELAESSNLAKSEFLSRMSHELRTPLNAMLGFAQLLELDQRHPLAEAQRPWVAQIKAAGWHLLEMINDVLDLSRIEAGALRLQPETLDLAELLAATRSLTEGAARQRGIVVTQDIAADASNALGDATRVKQILINLMSNAVKYNNDRGRIHISVRTLGAERVEIAVTDTGLGMTPAQLASLFQPFNRLGRERSAQQGTGIGLVISRRLAELMGGTLRARSVAGEGTSFILTLPRVVDADTVRSDLDTLHTTSTGYRTRNVHYVEDNETNVAVMRGILAQRLQVKLDVSVTGLDALAAIRRRRPDLILLDMHLPDIDGLELLRHLKAGTDTIDIPVVIVSADALPAQIDAAMQAGALRYLTKPVSVAELLATIDEVLGKIQSQFG
jgi:PAS domain S-box-containing protein